MILPGQDWKFEIRKAMKRCGAVLLCVSTEAATGSTAGIYPEALDAIADYREHRPGEIFLIPVRFSEYEIPPIEIDGTRTLDRLQHVDLFPPEKREDGVKRLLAALREALKIPYDPEIVQEAKGSEPSVEEPSPPVDSVKPAPYDPRNPVFFVPFRPKKEQVIGREKALQRVREQLTEGRRTHIGQAAAFLGLGGLGKTQLAVEYAYQYREAYPNGVIWLNADQSIDAQLTDLAERARWVAPESEHKFKLDIAQQRLRSYSGCLIIFDNVEKLEDIEDYLPEPQAEPHLLITSRTEQPGFPPIPLDPLNQELSLQLLIQEAGREPEGAEEEEAARTIADRLGGLPLALELAGAYLRHRRSISWRQYNDYLQQNLREALAGKVLASFTRHEADLYSTLKIQEEVFSDEPRLLEILDLLTWSGTAAMGESLLCALLTVDHPTKLTNALSLGVALRLLQKTPDEQRYAIHRLVGEVRREEIPLEERLDWVNDVCERLGAWFQERREDFADLPTFEAEIDHLRAWQGHALDDAREHASRLTWLQAYPPYYRGRYHEAKAWVQKARDVFSEVKEEDRTLEAHLLNDLDRTLSSLGDYRQALKYSEQALAIRREVLGERHPDTARSLSNVGGAYLNSGDYRQALKYTEQALAILREVLGERHPDTATSLSGVGAAYSDSGDYRQALEYSEQALAIRREVLGKRHPDTANSLNNVGAVYSDSGDYRQALEYFEQALAILRDVLGERHPSTATAFNSIGIVYSNLGDYRQAREYHEQALAIRREVLGEHHPDTVLSTRNRARVLANLGRGHPALQLLKTLLKELPKDHIHYDLIKQTIQEIQSGLPGFRKTSSKQKGRRKKGGKRGRR